MGKRTKAQIENESLGVTFSKNVKVMRLQRELTQAELAHAAGVTVETVARIERVIRGQRSANANPSLDTIASIAKALDVPAARLLS